MIILIILTLLTGCRVFQLNSTPIPDGKAQITPSPIGENAAKNLVTPLPSTGYVDACTLVTAADASSVMDVDFAGPAYSAQMHPGEPFTECQYVSGSKQVRVSAFRYAGPSTAMDSFKAQIQLWQKEKYFHLVQGLGDMGFENRNGAYYVKDYYIVNILVFYSPDLTAQINRDKAVRLAVLSAGRLR